MLFKESKKKIMAIIMASVIATTGVSTVLADTGTNTTTQQTSTTQMQKPPVPKTELDSLVKAGTITEAQETAIISAFNSTTTSYDEALNSLVKASTITEAQATTIKTAIKPSGTPGSQSGTAPGNPPSGTNGAPPSGSSSSSTVKGTGAYTLSGKKATKAKQTITATKANQSVVKVSNGGTLTLTGSTLVKKSGNTSSEDSSNFYGLNAGVLAESKSNITLKNCTINTSASGSNAVFSTGSGSKITVSNVKIKTTADSSRGLDATQKGTIIATNVQINTAGIHCAALATDRGNGTVTVNKGTLVTTGTDSPCIYSTGTITANNSKGTATGSEAAVVEGKNSISLTNTTLSGAKKNGVMMYQSTSGDAEVGTSVFTMKGGSLSAAVGSLFYITNTDSVINLTGVKTTAKSGVLLKASADRWGSTGSNGGVVTLNANAQTLSGSIAADNLSSVTVSLKSKSTLTSTINTNNTAKSIALKLDSSSKWSVTGTSYLTSLTDADTTLANIDDNGNTIYYDSTNSANSWLQGKTITLQDGGKLMPASTK